MYRKKKQKNKKAAILYNLILSIIPLAWLLFTMKGYDFIQATKLSVIVAVFVVLFLIAWSNLKKKIKRKKYLSSSLYQIDTMNPFEFEELVAEHFRNLGYKAKVTPKTGDYGVDLLLEKESDKIAVQVKRYRDKVGNKAVQEVVAGMHFYKCNKGMVVTNSYYTPQAEKMAAECNVELMNRNDLKKLFKIMDR